MGGGKEGWVVTDGPPRALVITPSRELAIQVLRQAEALCEGTGLRVAQVIGGANPKRQIEDIRKKKPHIIVGTPGRLAELVVDTGKVKISGVKHVVVDEVDQCLGDSYRDDVMALLKRVKRDGQFIFASATGGQKGVISLAERYMGDDAVMLEMEGRRRLPPLLRHCAILSPRMKHLDAVKRVFNLKGLSGLLIFVEDGRRVDVVCEQLLSQHSLVAAPLKGEAGKEDRQEVMRRLRAGTLGEKPLVVSTEIAARGLDVAAFTHVVNMDLPTDAEHYIHRAGRTGRAGRDGVAITLCEPNREFVLGKIGRALGIEFEKVSLFDGEIIPAPEE